MAIPSLNDIPELTIAPDGEYTLRILSAKDMETKDQNNPKPFLMLVTQFMDRDNTPNLIHKLWFPTKDDSKDKKTNKLRMIKDFCNSIGLDTTQEIPNEDFIGIEFQAIVKISEYDGREYNEIKKVL